MPLIVGVKWVEELVKFRYDLGWGLTWCRCVQCDVLGKEFRLEVYYWFPRNGGWGGPAYAREEGRPSGKGYEWVPGGVCPP